MEYRNTRSLIVRLSVLFALTGIVPAAFGNDSEFEVNLNCADTSRIFQKIQVNNGIMTEKAVVSAPVSTILIPLTRNDSDYLGCLEMHGRNTDVAKLAYFQDTDRCRRMASSKPQVSISSANNPVLTASFDRAAYSRCMRGKDRKLDVEIIGQ